MVAEFTSTEPPRQIVQELVLVCTDSPLHRADRTASRSLSVTAREMCSTAAWRIRMLLSDYERLSGQAN